MGRITTFDRAAVAMITEKAVRDHPNSTVTDFR